MTTQRNVLVTGAGGFIGGAIAREMQKRGHSVTVLRRPERAIAGFEQAITLDKLREPFDAIVHAAAIRHRHGIPAESYLTENTALTARLLDFARQSGSGRFTLISSIAVFGWPQKLPISDANPYAPVGPYGVSKVGCERKVRECGHPFSIVRPSITYGPGDTNGMIDKLLRLVSQGKYRVIGSGSARCQLVYVEDLAYAAAEATLRPDLAGAEFTCTYRDPISFQQLSEAAAETVGRHLPRPNAPLMLARLAATAFELMEKIGLIHGEPLVTHEKLATVTVDRAYDITRMRELLGWEPPTEYREGLKKTAAAMNLPG